MKQMSLDLGKVKAEYSALPKHLKEKLDGFLAIQRPSTATAYKSTLVHFLSNINNTGGLVLRQFNRENWEEYAAEHLEGMNERTYNNKVAAISSFFNYLIMMGERRNNPLEGVKRNKINKGASNRIKLTWSQILDLKDMHKRDKDDYLIFVGGYYRQHSMSQLKYYHDYTQGFVHDRVKKFGREVLGIEGLKYSDITEAHKRFFAVCPVTGWELEMTEDNWEFRDGLLQARKEV